jgi:hypothetical protein
MARAIIDEAAHPQAMNWYAGHPTEPGGTTAARTLVTLAVTSHVGLRGITLEAVLDDIIANVRSGEDVIIVGHGREGGLSMPLVTGSEARARAEHLGALAGDRAARDPLLGVLPPRADAEVAAQLGLAVPVVARIRAKMNAVRALRLRHVALRACNLGAWPNVLASFRPFFGCAHVSAPDLRDTFGHANPVLEPGLAHFDRRFGRGWHRTTYAAAAGRVVIATRGGAADEHGYDLSVGSDSEATLAAWKRRYLGRNGPFVYHGAWVTTPAPAEPQVIFVGDPAYAGHIILAE